LEPTFPTEFTYQKVHPPPICEIAPPLLAAVLLRNTVLFNTRTAEDTDCMVQPENENVESNVLMDRIPYELDMFLNWQFEKETVQFVTKFINEFEEVVIRSLKVHLTKEKTAGCLLVDDNKNNGEVEGLLPAQVKYNQ
jgi:hypothetical protein